jgi:hypothetical protein
VATLTDSAIGVKPRQIADWVTDAKTYLSTPGSQIRLIGATYVTWLDTVHDLFWRSTI